MDGSRCRNGRNSTRKTQKRRPHCRVRPLMAYACRRPLCTRASCPVTSSVSVLLSECGHPLLTGKSGPHSYNEWWLHHQYCHVSPSRQQHPTLCVVFPLLVVVVVVMKDSQSSFDGVACLSIDFPPDFTDTWTMVVIIITILVEIINACSATNFHVSKAYKQFPRYAGCFRLQLSSSRSGYLFAAVAQITRRWYR